MQSANFNVRLDVINANKNIDRIIVNEFVAGTTKHLKPPTQCDIIIYVQNFTQTENQ